MNQDMNVERENKHKYSSGVCCREASKPHTGLSLRRTGDPPRGPTMERVHSNGPSRLLNISFTLSHSRTKLLAHMRC
jgi:hypothetical protein